MTRPSQTKPGKTLVRLLKIKHKQRQTEEKLVEIYVQKCISTTEYFKTLNGTSLTNVSIFPINTTG